LLSSILSSIRKSTHWRRIDGQIWAVYLRKWPFRIDAVYALEACLFHDHRPCASPPSTPSFRAGWVTVQVSSWANRAPSLPFTAAEFCVLSRRQPASKTVLTPSANEQSLLMTSVTNFHVGIDWPGQRAEDGLFFGADRRPLQPAKIGASAGRSAGRSLRS
jgi:hypothetical protein